MKKKYNFKLKKIPIHLHCLPLKVVKLNLSNTFQDLIIKFALTDHYVILCFCLII